MMTNMLIFGCGLLFGVFVAVLIIALTNAKRELDDDPFDAEEFERFRDDWGELNDEYGVFVERNGCRAPCGRVD